MSVSRHRLLHLCQQRECQRHTSYEGPRSLVLPYPHIVQLQPQIPLFRDTLVYHVSRYPSLQLEVLTLLPRPHLFWVLGSLQMGCTLLHTSPHTPCSVDYAGYPESPPVTITCMIHRKWVGSAITCQGGGGGSGGAYEVV